MTKFTAGTIQLCVFLLINLLIYLFISLFFRFIISMALSRIKTFVVLCSLFAVVTFVIVQKSGTLSPKLKVIHHKRTRERGLE